MSKRMDDASLLLHSDAQEEQREAARDLELIRLGAEFLRMTETPGWPLLVAKVGELRGAIADQVLKVNEGEIKLDFVRGQADGAQRVIDMVLTAIQASKEAALRVREGATRSRPSRREAGESDGMVGE